jgi:hypothetical protein
MNVQAVNMKNFCMKTFAQVENSKNLISGAGPLPVESSDRSSENPGESLPVP